MLDEPT